MMPNPVLFQELPMSPHWPFCFFFSTGQTIVCLSLFFNLYIYVCFLYTGFTCMLIASIFQPFSYTGWTFWFLAICMFEMASNSRRPMCSCGDPSGIFKVWVLQILSCTSKPCNLWRGLNNYIPAACCKGWFWPSQLVAINMFNPGLNWAKCCTSKNWSCLPLGCTCQLPPIGMVRIWPYSRKPKLTCTNPSRNYKA